MSKNFLSCILCAALAASSLTVFAADAEKGQPDVYVNDSKIIFTREFDSCKGIKRCQIA